MKNFKIRESFSQFNEDIVLLSLYSALGNGYPAIFVDVGANDGRSWSNSFLFGKLDWNLLLVEPVPLMAQHCRNLYQGNESVVIEEMAISANRGFVDFFITNNLERDGLKMGSSLSREGVPFGLESIKATVETCPLGDLLKKHGVPGRYGILSVDAEGHDCDVLKSASLDIWTPLLVCVEKPEKDALSTHAYLTSFDYSLVVQTEANGIYLKNQGTGICS